MAEGKGISNILNFNTLFEHISNYFEAKIELVKIEAKEEMTKVAAKITGILILSFLGFMFVLMLTFTLSFLLNELLNSQYLGFVIITGFYLILLIIGVVMQVNGSLSKIIDKKMSSDTVEIKIKNNG